MIAKGEGCVICQKCGEPISDGISYDALIVHRQVDNGKSISVTYSEEISSYHQECSPFKFDLQGEKLR